MMRWSDAWELESLHRLRDKYNLSKEGWLANRIAKVGWRRRFYMIRPFLKWIPSGTVRRWIESPLVRLDKQLNRHLTQRFERLNVSKQPSDGAKPELSEAA